MSNFSRRFDHGWVLLPHRLSSHVHALAHALTLIMRARQPGPGMFAHHPGLMIMQVLSGCDNLDMQCHVQTLTPSLTPHTFSCLLPSDDLHLQAIAAADASGGGAATATALASAYASAGASATAASEAVAQAYGEVSLTAALKNVSPDAYSHFDLDNHTSHMSRQPKTQCQRHFPVVAWWAVQEYQTAGHHTDRYQVMCCCAHVFLVGQTYVGVGSEGQLYVSFDRCETDRYRSCGDHHAAGSADTRQLRVN